MTVILDVRTPDEFASGHLDSAINIDVMADDFEQAIESLPKGEAIQVYCHAGVRAGRAGGILEAAGFGPVENLGGLVDAAAATGLPVVTD